MFSQYITNIFGLYYCNRAHSKHKEYPRLFHLCSADEAPEAPEVGGSWAICCRDNEKELEWFKVLGHGEICSNRSHCSFVSCVVLPTTHVLLNWKRCQQIDLLFRGIKKEGFQITPQWASFLKNRRFQNEHIWLFCPLKILAQSCWLIATSVHFTFISAHSAQYWPLFFF